MGKHTDQVNVRLGDRIRQMIAALRKHHADSVDIPTTSDIVRDAVTEKFERDIGSAKRPRGKHAHSTQEE